MKRILVPAVLGVAAIALVGCSSSGSGSASASASPSKSPAASASASASSSTSSSPGSVLPPVIIGTDQNAASVKVGDTVVFSVPDPLATTITSDNPAVMPVTQGYTDGSATFNPGGKAQQAGLVKITLTTPNQPDQVVRIDVS